MTAGLTCRRCNDPMASDEKHCQTCAVWAQDTLCDCGSGASLADCSPEYGGGSTVTAICCDADGVVTTYYSDREPVIERPSALPLSFEERQVVRRFDEAPAGLCPLCDGVGEVQARLPHVLTWERILRGVHAGGGAMTGQERSLSPLDWAVLDELRRHSYDYRQKASKPDDPGWHACMCGWEGYWCGYQPHVAERIVANLPVPAPARGES